MGDVEERLVPMRKLGRDLKIASSTLTTREVQYLVHGYYMFQELRKAAANQVRAATKAAEPHAVIQWFEEQANGLEREIAKALDGYSGSQELGRWARGIDGIGPIIAAGLLAHIDLTKAPTAGHIWAFAGLDPTRSWKKGQKRPWNAALKTLCWKIGESFVKVSGKDSAIYGQVYAERKARENARNDQGEFATQAAAGAARVGKNTIAYKFYAAGKLPPGHIHARAKRYSVKLFLAHYHERGRGLLGLPVPLPYPIGHLGHVHRIAAP